jgi:hypothetical protein
VVAPARNVPFRLPSATSSSIIAAAALPKLAPPSTWSCLRRAGIDTGAAAPRSAPRNCSAPTHSVVTIQSQTRLWWHKLHFVECAEHCQRKGHICSLAHHKHTSGAICLGVCVCVCVCVCDLCTCVCAGRERERERETERQTPKQHT